MHTHFTQMHNQTIVDRLVTCNVNKNKKDYFSFLLIILFSPGMVIYNAILVRCLLLTGE